VGNNEILQSTDPALKASRAALGLAAAAQAPAGVGAAQPQENIFCNQNGQQIKLNGARLPR